MYGLSEYPLAGHLLVPLNATLSVAIGGVGKIDE